METEQPYANREIDQRFDSATFAITNLREELLAPVTGILTRVLAQTTEHNHRMSKMESWRNYITGAVAALGFMIVAIGVPILIELIKVGKI